MLTVILTGRQECGRGDWQEAGSHLLQGLQASLSPEAHRAQRLRDAQAHQRLPQPEVLDLRHRLLLAHGLRTPHCHAAAHQGR